MHTIVYTLPFRFEWDENKDRANEACHGLSFEAVLSVFDDPGALIEYNSNVGGEERWQAIGFISEIVIVVVVIYTIREENSAYETYRIISARKASKQERRRYEEAAK